MTFSNRPTSTRYFWILLAVVLTAIAFANPAHAAGRGGTRGILNPGNRGGSNFQGRNGFGPANRGINQTIITTSYGGGYGYSYGYGGGGGVQFVYNLGFSGNYYPSDSYYSSTYYRQQQFRNSVAQPQAHTFSLSPISSPYIDVWVDPVYREVTERIWVEPGNKTVYDKVWVPPVMQTVREAVWVSDPPTPPGTPGTHRFVVIVPNTSRYETRFREVEVQPGYFRDVPRSEFVDGHYEDIPILELITPGHYETREVNPPGEIRAVPSRVLGYIPN